MNIKFYEKNTFSKKTAKRIQEMISKPLNKIKEKIQDLNINIQYFDLQKPKLLKSLQVYITLKSGKEYYFVKSHTSILEASVRMRGLIKSLINKTDSSSSKNTEISLN